MPSFPETIIDQELKIYRGMSSVTTQELAARIMESLAREGHRMAPLQISEDILGKAGISRKQWMTLYAILPDH